METFELQVKPRTVEGSRKARNVRRQELIPAIVYGHGMKPLALEIPEREFLKAIQTKAGENVMISLKVEGVTLQESTCLIKAMQHDPVTDQISHVDLMMISMTEKITVKVPVVVVHGDEAPGVKEGGALDVVHYEIEVECLPTQIPEKIEIDVKDMKINDVVHVSQLVITEGVQCLLDPEDVVVAIRPPREEEVAAPAEDGPAQPEVIEKGKKDKEGEDGEAPKASAPAKETK
ncbi:MAG: 50S ribosomal protein L25 [Candidatus Omnitrophica bacterium ADurb.Bin292]|jgi:large subunit ribosomal protein L25|nr:MAG: 50S ribosomal protein L25 [Candidatus Omnitrophica bacterium ADurb.Bin292]